MSKAFEGNYFEDFRLNQEIIHATPRTIREGDLTAYLALTGSRFVLQSSSSAARRLGLAQSPIDDIMAFNVIFGKSVPDISLNAIANLGYAEGRFFDLVYPGDTLTTVSKVIGLKENSNGKTGVVYVRSTGLRNDQDKVLEYVRWVMVQKREQSPPSQQAVIPELKKYVPSADLTVSKDIDRVTVSVAESGSKFAFEDYEIGERIDHVDGMGIMESEHRMATRLYQNTAKVHFNDYAERQGRLGATIVYGGVVISLARALSFNGLGNILNILAVNSGKHVNPCVAGDTIFAWSEILDRAPLREDAGALRLRLVATKNQPCSEFPRLDEQSVYRSHVVLDLDYWALVPTRLALI